MEYNYDYIFVCVIIMHRLVMYNYLIIFRDVKIGVSLGFWFEILYFFNFLVINYVKKFRTTIV